MSTPQQRFYQKNSEKVRAYKKEHYAKKSNKKIFDLFKNIQLKEKTKSESRRIIKNAIATNALAIYYKAPDAQHLFDEFGVQSRINWTPQEWIDNERSPIRIDQKTIIVEYKENATYYFRTNPCPSDRQVLEITFEPWMLVAPMMSETA